jgi:hypothetical protein
MQPVTAIKFSESYGRGNSVLFLNTNDGKLIIKFLRENASTLLLNAYNNIVSYPPPDTDHKPIHARFRKGRIFADMVKREQEEADAKHQRWEEDGKQRLKHLMMRTLKRIEQDQRQQQQPIKNNVHNERLAIKINIQAGLSK